LITAKPHDPAWRLNMVAGTISVTPIDMLVVDDDGPTRAVIIETLEFAGYRARGAPDGASALALAGPDTRD
jgi:PleD family two-component response regulator